VHLNWDSRRIQPLPGPAARGAGAINTLPCHGDRTVASAPRNRHGCWLLLASYSVGGRHCVLLLHSWRCARDNGMHVSMWLLRFPPFFPTSPENKNRALTSRKDFELRRRRVVVPAQHPSLTTGVRIGGAAVDEGSERARSRERH
jgi:hypothetical protein